MAERLLKYYKYAADEGGIVAKMRLSQETRMPSTKAALEPDSPDNVAMFRAAVERVTGKAAPEF